MEETNQVSLHGTLNLINIILTQTKNKNNCSSKTNQVNNAGLNSKKDQKNFKSLIIQNKDIQSLVNIKKLIKKE